MTTEFSGKNHFAAEPSDALRCELVRSATAVVTGEYQRGGERLTEAARDLLLREFKAAEPVPRPYETGIEGYKPLTDEERAEFVEGMAEVRKAAKSRAEGTMWDVSRDRREGGDVHPPTGLIKVPTTAGVMTYWCPSPDVYDLAREMMTTGKMPPGVLFPGPPPGKGQFSAKTDEAGGRIYICADAEALALVKSQDAFAGVTADCVVYTLELSEPETYKEKYGADDPDHLADDLGDRGGRNW